MAGTDPQMFIKIVANIDDLKAAMAQARQAVLDNSEAVKAASAASAGWTATLGDLGHSWVLRVAEGQLLRDAIREVIDKMKEMAEFFPELAMKGSVFGDVEQAFHHLTEQAGLLSETLLTTLRSGTHGTIDDFDLMQRVNKDLAAGLNLTDAQFGLLSQGAFALAKATGGDVKTALDSMNDAMVTGRTKAIALLTGKIDLKAAEEAFAVSLGGTIQNLTAEGKLQADRQAILAAVSAGMGRLGEQTDSLKDKVTQGQIAWSNFEDELGKAIAQSPVIAAGFDTLRASLAAAFGPDQKQQIAAIASIVDQVAIHIIELGIGATQVATVMVTAWSLIETPILAVETLIVGIVTAIGEVLLKAEQLAGKLHLVDPTEVDRIKDTQVQLRAMTASLADQTAEAAKGVVGQSALNATIDKAAGALFVMRDNMVAAAAAQRDGASAAAGFIGPLQEASGAVKAHGDYLKESAAEIKVWAAVEAKAIAETTKLWDEYATLVAEHGGTAQDILRAKIDQTFNDQVAKLDESFAKVTHWTDDVTARYEAAYSAIAAVAHEKLNGVNVDWTALAAASKESLQQTYDKAQATYEAAASSSLHFSAAAMQHFRDLRDAARAALFDMQDTAESAFSAINDAVMGVATSFEGWNAAIMKVSDSLDSVAQKAQKAQSAVYKFSVPTTVVTADNKDSLIARLKQIEDEYKMFPGRQNGVNGPTGIRSDDAVGWSAMLNEQIEFASLKAALPGYAGGVTNAPGGWAMVGEQGPEMMFVPSGANILPNGYTQRIQDFLGSQLTLIDSLMKSAVGPGFSSDMQALQLQADKLTELMTGSKSKLWMDAAMANAVANFHTYVASTIAKQITDDQAIGLPAFASGVRNAPGGLALVGERGPEIMEVPRGANIYPNGSSIGGGITIAPGAVVIQLSALTPGDARVGEQLRQTVEKVIVDTLKNRVQLGSA